ncbi:MAG: DNA gyrase/topoisomerase IV subunit A, partial [Chitinophagaceae bacterium]
KMQFNIKRFHIETTTLHNKFLFIKEGVDNYLDAVTTAATPILWISTGRGAQLKKQKIKVANLVDVMGWKAVGTKLIDFSKSIALEWEQTEAKPDAQQKLF